MINFNDYINNKTNKQYLGSTDIHDISINDEDYLLKMQSKITEPNSIETSYRNNCIAEYIGCKIIKMMNYPVQEVILGTIDIKNKEKIAVACKDFTKANEELYIFNNMRSPFLDNDIKYPFKNLELEIILNNISKLNINGIKNTDLLKRFWEQFVIDAFIGNYDRHNGNWGYILNKSTRVASIAPIYDCGASFDSKLSKEQMEYLLDHKNMFIDYVLKEHKSAIRINNKKIVYSEYFANSKNNDFFYAFKKIYKLINIENIVSFINKIDEIDTIHKNYYSSMLYIKEKFLFKELFLKLRNINANNKSYKM